VVALGAQVEAELAVPAVSLAQLLHRRVPKSPRLRVEGRDVEAVLLQHLPQTSPRIAAS